VCDVRSRICTMLAAPVRLRALPITEADQLTGAARKASDITTYRSRYDYNPQISLWYTSADEPRSRVYLCPVLQDQFGLKLEPSKANIEEVIVIEKSGNAVRCQWATRPWPMAFQIAVTGNFPSGRLLRIYPPVGTGHREFRSASRYRPSSTLDVAADAFLCNVFALLCNEPGLQ